MYCSLIKSQLKLNPLYLLAVIRVEKAPQQSAVKDVRFKSLMDALVPPKTVSQEKTENRIPNGLDGRRASV